MSFILALIANDIQALSIQGLALPCYASMSHIDVPRCLEGMTITLRQILLIVLLLTSVGIGGWAYVAPVSWYTSFPGFGFTWLPPLGPFNEHLAKDVGAMFLGLGVLSVGGLIMIANSGVIRLVAATWSAFNILHLVFHLRMLHMYGATDQVLVVVALSALVVASVALFVPVRRAGSDI